MRNIKTSLFLMATVVSYSYWSFGQTSPSPLNPPSNTVQIEPEENAAPSYNVASIVPAYKIALKKKMFEVSGGLGHIDENQPVNNGQSQNVKKNPQTDFFPFQVAYAFTDNFNISVAGKIMRTTEKVGNTSFEGTSEPQFSASYAFRNAYSVFLLTGVYTADIGPREILRKGLSREEGNTLKGGASGEVIAGYFARVGPMILGGEASYLYKDTRIVNESDIPLFTGESTAPKQIRYEGGAEKSLRAVAELATSFRLGVFFGRTWIEAEELIISNQLGNMLGNSYYKNFFGAYGRIQIHPRLSVLPLLSVTEAPDTSGFSNYSNHEVLTQVNLRFRF